MNIVIFGAPGAGKGTQSALLVERKGMHHISTGDLFRAAIKNETELGLKAKEYMDKGELVPDAIVVGMVEEVFSGLGGKNFILDGFPRTTAQAEALEKMLGQHEKSIGKAVFLHVPRDLLMDRLTGRRLCKDCGAVYHVSSHPPKKEGVCDQCNGSNLYQRDDDKASVIGTRLEAYEKSTSPLIDYYKSNNQYVEIDGVGDTESVFDQIAGVLTQ